MKIFDNRFDIKLLDALGNQWQVSELSVTKYCPIGNTHNNNRRPHLRRHFVTTAVVNETYAYTNQHVPFFPGTQSHWSRNILNLITGETFSSFANRAWMFGRGQTCCVVVYATLSLFWCCLLFYFGLMHIIPLVCAFFCIIFPFFVVVFGEIVVVFFVSFFDVFAPCCSWCLRPLLVVVSLFLLCSGLKIILSWSCGFFLHVFRFFYCVFWRFFNVVFIPF